MNDRALTAGSLGRMFPYLRPILTKADITARQKVVLTICQPGADLVPCTLTGAVHHQARGPKVGDAYATHLDAAFQAERAPDVDASTFWAALVTHHKYGMRDLTVCLDQDTVKKLPTEARRFIK